MKIIEEYRRVTEEIYTTNSVLTSINRDIKKLINAYRPGNLKGIDYSKDKVQNSQTQINIFDNYAEMQSLLIERDNTELELKSLHAQRDELEKCIYNLGDIEKKALMLRIKGYSNRRIADTLHYSLRGIEAIFKRAKEKSKKNKECGENVVDDVLQ